MVKRKRVFYLSVFSHIHAKILFEFFSEIGFVAKAAKAGYFCSGNVLVEKQLFGMLHSDIKQLIRYIYAFELFIKR